MTARGVGLTVGAAALMAVGWRSGWPEITALGAGAFVLVVAVVLLAGPRPRVTIAVEQPAMRVTRGQAASARVRLSFGRRRHWLRLVDGAPTDPRWSLPLPRGERGSDVVLRVPVDTSTRGQRSIGPYSVVHSDPWSIVRRVAGHDTGGLVTVQPRTYPLRRTLLAQLAVAESELSSRKPGDQHFHALREYVLGDEPRLVHWRSSARVGQLVVRQQVAAATNGTTVVLDVDGSAYGSDDTFGSGWLAERFESAVEVAASVCASQGTSAEQVHLVTSATAAQVATAASGAVNGLLDVLAVVDAVPPVDTAPAALPELVRRTRCARAVFVTGTASPQTLQAARAIARTGVTTMLVRVGAANRVSVVGVHVLDVERAEELV